MPTSPRPQDENLRIQSLYSLNILDTQQEPSFDQLTELASLAVQCPFALITFVDTERQWNKACFGLDATEINRDDSFCSHAIMTPNQPLIVADATQDVRFRNNPMVVHAPKIRFYAGFPIHSPRDGFPIGTICVADTKARNLSDQQSATMSLLARQTEQLLETSLNQRSIARIIESTNLTSDEFDEYASYLLANQFSVENSSEAVFWIRKNGSFSYVNKQATNYLGYSAAELCEMTVADINPAYPLSAWPGHWEETKRLGVLRFESSHQRKDGTRYDCEITKHFLAFEGSEFIFATVRDITHTNQLKSDLDRTVTELDQIIEHLPLSFVAADPERRIKRVNKTFREEFGYTDDEVLGKKTRLIYASDHEFESAGKTNYNRANRNGQHPFHARYRKKNGTEFIGETIGTVLRDIDDQPHTFLGLIQDINERIEDRQNLIRTQRSLDEAAESVFWIGTRGEFLYANDAACTSLGFSQSELVSRFVHDIDTNVDSSEEFVERFGKRLHREQSLTFESEHRRKDGTVMPVEIVAKYFEFENESFICAHVRDITARKESERSLIEAKLAAEESELRFRRLADSASTLSWTTELDSQCSWLNKRWLEYSGRTMEQEIGFGWVETVHPEDRESVKAAYFDAFEKRIPFVVPYRLRRFDGEYRWHTVNATPRFDDSGEFVGFVGMSIDDHDARTNLDRLAASRKVLEDVSESRRAMLELLGTSDGVWEWKVGSSEAKYAPGFRKLLGFAGEDDSSFPDTLEAFESRIHSDDRNTFWDSVQQSLLSKSQFNCEFRIEHSQGHDIWVRTRGKAIYNHAGEPKRLIGSTYDITPQKHAENEIKRKNAELVRANKDLEQFAHVAAHDLQEPLRAVAGFTQLLARKYANELDETGRGYIQKAVEGASRMKSLIEDLLYFSRVTLEPSRFTTVDLRECILHAQAALQSAIHDTKTKIEIGAMPIVNGVESHLVQIFQNLIGNAIKYRTKRPPEIEISAERNEQHFSIHIRDNGIGIPEKYRDQIFKIFYRLHTREDIPGTGLGLAICQRIAEQHGGSITISSNKPTGSCFTVNLPVPATPKSRAAEI